MVDQNEVDSNFLNPLFLKVEGKFSIHNFDYKHNSEEQDPEPEARNF
jgi:hypothetical protein